jgi:hypothetical protein
MIILIFPITMILRSPLKMTQFEAPKGIQKDIVSPTTGSGSKSTHDSIMLHMIQCEMMRDVHGKSQKAETNCSDIYCRVHYNDMFLCPVILVYSVHHTNPRLCSVARK